VNLPFALRGLPGRLDIAVEANHDPERFGCGLLADDIDARAAEGFPVCTATIRYDRDGYAAAFGWIQLVRSTDDPTGGAEFDLDPLALLCDVETPYAFFGVKPLLFDAPFRATRDDLRWQAHTFLCFAPDAVMSKVVHATTGFSWGFDLTGGRFTFDVPRPLSPAEWDAQLPRLTDSYPSWTFVSGFRTS
jgi:hypothetical protein